MRNMNTPPKHPVHTSSFRSISGTGFTMKTTLLSVLSFVAFALHPLLGAPGWTVDYIDLGGGIGDVGEVRAFWNLTDNTSGTGASNGPLAIGNPVNVGGDNYDVQQFATQTGVQNINIRDGGVGGGAALPIPTTDSYTIRARTTVTFNMGGTYTIAAASDDGRYIRLTPIKTAGPVVFNNVGGQTNGDGTRQLSPTEIAFPNGTGFQNAWGSFDVSPCDVVQVEVIMWEGGGGDGFEVHLFDGPSPVASGNQALPGVFSFLEDNAFGNGSISIDDVVVPNTYPVPANPGMLVDAFRIDGANGATDNQLNSADEAYAIWDQIDNTGFAAGPIVPGLTPATTYNVAAFNAGITMQELDLGGGGNYAVNDSFAGLLNISGEDFSVRARATVGIPVGTWTIASGGDDQTYVQLPGVTFTSNTGLASPMNLLPTGPGTDAIAANSGCCNETVGSFTITEDMANCDGYFYTTFESAFIERGGGDWWQVSIAPGGWGGTQWNPADASWPGGHNSNQFRLLADGMFGWVVSTNTVDEALAECGAQQLANADPLPPALLVEKTNLPGITGICPGDQIRYDIRVSNLGDTPSCGIALTDTLLSPGMQFAAMSDNFTSIPAVDKCTGAPVVVPVTRTVTSNAITWVAGTTNSPADLGYFGNIGLPPGFSFTFQVYVDTDTNAVDCTILTNQIAQLAPDGRIVSEGLDFTTVYYPDLAIGKDVTNLTFGGRECAFANDVLQYTLSITNLGKCDRDGVQRFAGDRQNQHGRHSRRHRNHRREHQFQRHGEFEPDRQRANPTHHLRAAGHRPDLARLDGRRLRRRHLDERDHSQQQSSQFQSGRHRADSHGDRLRGKCRVHRAGKRRQLQWCWTIQPQLTRRDTARPVDEQRHLRLVSESGRFDPTRRHLRNRWRDRWCRSGAKWQLPRLRRQ